MNPNDIVGMRFGKLRVTALDGYYDKSGSGSNYHWYRCVCDCGKVCLSRRDHLIDGRKKSCGRCYKIIPEEGHMRYICQNGNSFIFDADDYGLFSNRFCYVTTLEDGCGHVMSRASNGRIEQVSRLILNLSGTLFVDHINGDHLDNRKSNLRIATVKENSRNAVIRNDNTSGFKGVSFFRRRGKYRAYINIDQKQKHLGYFNDPEEAARAYDEAARYYFGEFACVNFPLPGEQGCLRNQPQKVAASA